MTKKTGPHKADTPKKGGGAKQRSIAEARDHLAGLVHDVEGGPAVHITRRGKPVAVLLAYAEYQRLLGEGPSFWDALLSFREHARSNDDLLDIEPRTFARDKSPGRPVTLS
jgi:prevent-host-death family protein